MKFHRLYKSCCLAGALLCVLSLPAQYDPPAGQPGSLAMYKDSSAFVAWANACTVYPGYQDVSNTSLGFANAGDSSMALGIAGLNATVSLGDGGYAIVRFSDPIGNGPGPDFAVFENGFSDTFLEMAFVEVSSDGINYFRFPAVSNTQDTVQVTSFGAVDATQVHNLAGKYRMYYGTPFDLDEMDSIPGLDVTRVTHVKIVDVIGCIQETYATFDSQQHKVNDPWPTGFASGGFDLDAVGVIHVNPAGVTEYPTDFISFYPNPAQSGSVIHLRGNTELLRVYTSSGELVWESSGTAIETSGMKPGIYFIESISGGQIKREKLLLL